jgi:transposase-like protein
MENNVAFTIPAWVPEGAQRYLAHTETGQSIRDIARSAGCHASTILRQIRRIEMRRDDPLVDAALQTLAEAHFSDTAQQSCTFPAAQEDDLAAAEEKFNREAMRVLRRLCETGSVLAVAEEMDKAVVVRDAGDSGTTRTAVVDCKTAQALALKDWITCDNPGRISRYRISTSGRAALSQLVAEAENKARNRNDFGMAEAQVPFQTASSLAQVGAAKTERPRRIRYSAAESPLIALARRRDRDGKPFLDEALVRAGERLREDFELAQIGPQVAQNWDHFLTAGGRGSFGAGVKDGRGSSDARDRVERALSDLGPGLSDVALRCCCYLEGLELAEKRMGWSARSGKIVLRIALQRLKRHYESQAEKSRMIG